MNAESCLVYDGGAGGAMNFDARLCVSESGVTVISWTLRGFGKKLAADGWPDRRALLLIPRAELEGPQYFH